METGALDVAAVTLRRAVVEGEQQRPLGGEAEKGPLEQQASGQGSAATQRGQEVVVGGEAGCAAGGAAPTRDGPPASGEEGAAPQDRESPGVSLVEHGSPADDEIWPQGRQEGTIPSGSLGWSRGRIPSPTLAREPFVRQKIAMCLRIGDY